MIQAQALSKAYGQKTVVDRLNCTVRPGIVTGFLGPNVAGKSTTMRMILGLDRPSSFVVTVNRKLYADLPAPLIEVGALLEARSVHTGRSAYHHLLALARTHGIFTARVRQVIDLVGLTEVARQLAGAFSLGVGQRLGIASALLGDPGTLILDEPVNGLDPDGILWIRNLAAEGRTVLVSSHLMSEMSLIAEHLIVVGNGKLIADLPIAELLASSSRASVPQPEELGRLLAVADGAVTHRDGAMEVTGFTAGQIGDLVLAHHLPIHELTPQKASLEEAFMQLTNESVEYHAGTTIGEKSAA